MIFIFPDHYKYGLPNLAVQTLYKQAYDIPYVLPDRFYLPKSEDNSEYKTLDYEMPLSSADILAFTIPYEGLIFNFIKILNKAVIPLKYFERGEHNPIILCGGPVVNYNPVPISLFGDIFVLGEAEETIQDILKLFYEHKDKHHYKRKSFLEDVSKLQGCYIPPVHGTSGYKIVKQTKPVDVNKFPSHSIFISKGTVYGVDTFSIEVRRGCTQMCRFCYMGNRLLPARTLNYNLTKELVDTGLKYSKIIKLFYESLVPAEVEGLLEYVLQKGGKPRIGSQRLERISENIIKLVAKAEQRKLTVAPETSQRLRKVVGKESMDNNSLFKVAKLSSYYGIPDFGLYFIIGLPFEDERDLQEIADIIVRVRHEMDKTGNIGGELEVGINILYPKPFTPFQYAKTLLPREAEERLNYIVSQIRYNGCNVVISNEVVNERVERRNISNTVSSPIKIETTISTPVSLYQPIISRGGSEISNVILEVYNLGSDGFENWYRAFEKCGVDYKKYSDSYHNIEGHFPWELQDTLISPLYLLKQYEKIFLTFSG